MKIKKGWQPVSVEGFSKACPICKNDGSDLCFECKMEIGKSGFEIKDGFEPTNADRIRAMSDEELAKYICEKVGWDCHFCEEHFRLDNEPLMHEERCDEQCTKHCLEWLKQPAEVEG